MSTWNEQLLQIKKLRHERQKNDDALFAAQVKLRKAGKQLLKAMKGETVLPADRQAIDDLRKQMTAIEKQLQQLNNELNEGVAAKLQLVESRISFVQKKLQALTAQLAELEQQQADAIHEQPLDEAVIKKLAQQVEQMEKAIEALKAEQGKLKQEQATLKQHQQDASGRRREIQAQKNRLQEQVQALTDKLNEALTPPARDPQQEAANNDKLKEEYERAKKALEGTHIKLHEAVKSIYIDPHPRKLVPNLNDRTPFLFIPIRIETRFIDIGRQQNELWVRVYPDDIAVHTHEKILTDKEVEEGEKYWIALFKAQKTDGANLEDSKKAAWSTIADLFSPQRAAWVGQQTKPVNWAQADVTEVEQLDFPEHDLTKNDSWSRAPRTNLMPDRFVVMLYQGDMIVKEVVGNVIPDELLLGPDPMEAKDAFIKQDGKLQFGDAFNWTSDFSKAVEVGMGFKIPVSVDEAQKGFTKVLVLGLYLSSDENESKTAIEELIDNHHYSPKGFSLVKQGSPTNNTDESGSGYTKNDPFNDTSFFVETGKPLFDETDDCDGKNLADALGINYTPLQYILNSDGGDYRRAVAMNTALYPGTLGYYFDSMLPVLSENNEDKLREFFTKHVTGQGPLPAIRVGNQPYGILLTSDFSNWKWTERDNTFGLPFLNGLLTTIQKYHAIWLSLLNQIPYTGKPGKETDPSGTLMNILGLQPASVSFYQRVAYSTDYLNTLDAFKYGGKYYADMAKNFISKNDVLLFLQSLGFSGSVTQLLRLVYQHYHTTLDAANLVDNVPLSEKEGIRFYDTALQKNYLHWLSEATSTTVMEQQDFGGKPKPNALLYLNLRRSLLLQLHKAAVRWFGKRRIDVKDTMKATNFHNILVEPTLTKWETMKAKVQVAEPNHVFKNLSIADYLLTKGRDEEEAAYVGDMRQSLKELANASTAQLERCFTGHIDTCSYRLDAWQTGLFHLRLKSQRSAVIDEQQTNKQGIYLAAFGWVEDLKPAARKIATENIPDKLKPANGAPLYEYDDNNGFVHAPSINQAAAAAVLRSGYVSHAKTDKPEVMSVNLSSERVRRALFILQGIRNGQQLEALLGYQFERALHDAASSDQSVIRLNEYIYNFRDKFPLQLHYIQQQGTGLPIEAIPANNVVNGLRLSEATGDTPYGAIGSVASASEAEKVIIRREKDKLADTLDAVKDLLLSESVYQLVQGNFDRSGAVINALKDTSVPPEIDVIQTPRASQLSFTNRVTVQFDPGMAANPWAGVPMTTRAIMEPGLNNWLGGVLGQPDQIFFRVAHLDADGNEIAAEDITADKLNLQPIDWVYITGNELNTGAAQSGQEHRTGASELEARIAYYYRTLLGIDNTVPVRIEFLKPAVQTTVGKLLPLVRQLKALITDSRSLNAQDFDPPSKESIEDETNPKGYNVTELQDRVQLRLNSFQTNLSTIQGLSIDATVKDKDGNDQHYYTLQSAFDALKAASQDFAAITYVFGDTESEILRDTLLSVAETGISGTFPNTHTFNSDTDKLSLLQQASSVAARMKDAADKATSLMAEAGTLTEIDQQVEKLIAAGKAILGDVFNILPRFTYNNEADILLSHANRNQLFNHATNELELDYPADEWLQNAAHVRPKLSRWDYILSLYECYQGERLALQPVQLPYRVNDSWLAVGFPEKDPDVDPDFPDKPFSVQHDTLSITIHGAAAFTPASHQCGLLLDDWTEMVPQKNEVTGIGFHYNQPNATPPQALLLAVTPQEKGYWTWDDLVNILNDTLLRAKLRAVEPDMLDKLKKSEVGVLLPAILSDFSQYDLTIALDYRLNLEYVYTNNPVMAVQLAKS